MNTSKAQDPLLGINLLFLRTFLMVFEERSVSEAAQRLALTPSAVSHSLRKLRQALGDELFMREAGQMVPTPFAAAIAPQIGDLLQRMRSVLQHEHFDPETSDHSFAVASLPYSTWLVMTKVTACVLRQAKNVKIRTFPFDDTIPGLLEAGTIDVALGNFLKVPPGIERATLFTDRIVWVMRKAHPLAAEPMTTSLISRTRQLKVDIGRAKKRLAGAAAPSFEHLITLDDYGALEDQLTIDRLDQTIVTVVPDIVSGFSIVAETDLLMPAPATIAKAYADYYGLRVCDAPYPNAGIDIHMIWHKEHGRRDSVAWLRAQMMSVAKQLAR